MYKSLIPDLLKINCTPLETIAYAKKHGFEGVEYRFRHGGSQVTSENVSQVKQAMADAGVRAGNCSLLTGKSNDSDEDWEANMTTLDERCAIAAELGFTRSMWVLMPFHETLDYQQCWDMHVSRLTQAGTVMAKHGIRLGLEYISPLTRRKDFQMQFIHDLKGTLKLLADVNLPNVGLMLDSMHWYCARETASDLTALTNDQVVAVHVNDAIADREIDEQSAFERDLPGETGMIDLDGFHDALRQIGYDGPVTCEPLHPTKWDNRDPDELLGKLSACMDRYLVAGTRA